MKNFNAKKILMVVTADVLLFAVLLLGFAWFHHVKPKSVPESKLSFMSGAQTPAPNSEPTARATEPPATPEPTATITASPEPGSTYTPTEIPTETPAETPTPAPSPVNTNGLLKGKFAEKFTDGEIIYTDEAYRSANVCIEVSDHEIKVESAPGSNYFVPAHYYLADIYIQDITSLRCAISQSSNNKDRVEDLCNQNNGILATSGDYFIFHSSGLVIRNGELYRDALHPDQDVCVLYQDGTMETYLKGQINLDYIYGKMPYHAWSFGPRLLEEGQPMTVFNTSVETWNPRCAIGYYEPGHYCLVVVDGRQEPDYSYGLRMYELSKLMYDLGCTEAYNLDGGMTAMMAYKGEIISKPAGGGRQNCDIVYVAEPLE